MRLFPWSDRLIVELHLPSIIPYSCMHFAGTLSSGLDVMRHRLRLRDSGPWALGRSAYAHLGLQLACESHGKWSRLRIAQGLISYITHLAVKSIFSQLSWLEYVVRSPCAATSGPDAHAILRKLLMTGEVPDGWIDASPGHLNRLRDNDDRECSIVHVFAHRMYASLVISKYVLTGSLHAFELFLFMLCAQATTLRAGTPRLRA